MPVDLYPGWPLPEADYAPLLLALESRESQQLLTIGHSLGALHAVNAHSDPDRLLVLLAPSVPKRRRGRATRAAALRGMALVPGVSSVAATALRRLTYRRFGVEMPSGAPVPLRDAARALAEPISDVTINAASCLVIVSREDPRCEEQIRFAHELKAHLAYVVGGHLFPIVEPLETSRSIDSWATGL